MIAVYNIKLAYYGLHIISNNAVSDLNMLHCHSLKPKLVHTYQLFEELPAELSLSKKYWLYLKLL